MVQKRIIWQLLSVVLIILVIVSQPLCYFISSDASRISIIFGFIVLLVLGFLSQVKKGYLGNGVTYAVLFGASGLFILWSTSFFSANYIADVLHTDRLLFAQQYSFTGHLSFVSGHSYFFLPSMMMFFFNTVCALSYTLSLYLSFGLEFFVVALIGLMIFRFVQTSNIGLLKNASVKSLLPFFIAMSFIAFINTNREDAALLLTPLLLYFLFKRGFKSRSDGLITLLLVIGITLGSATGALFLIVFFFVFAFFSDAKTKLLYSFIPLAYVFISAYSYSLMITQYTSVAWSGFIGFLNSALSGQISSRVEPWQRAQLTAPADTYVLTISYLSVLLLSVVIAFTLTFYRNKNQSLFGHRNINAGYSACLICLWLFLAIATATYLGFSVTAESSSSDVREIVFVFIMLCLPFILSSKKLFRALNVSKLLVVILIALTVIASFQTVYSIYPKSVKDPINAVEDSRLEPVSKYAASSFLSNAAPAGSGIALDYKVYLANALSLSEFGVSMLSNDTISADGKIEFSVDYVGFDINGLKYGSIYISPEIYSAAYELTQSHDTVYDSGNIIIVLTQNIFGNASDVAP